MQIQNPRVRIKRRVEKINKKVRRWLYKLTDEIEQFTFIFRKQKSKDHEIWEKPAYFERIYTPPTITNDAVSEFMANCVEDPLFIVSDASTQNFRRALVKGSMASRRRKLVIHKFYKPHSRSPLFLGQEDPPIFVEAILDAIYWVGQKLKLIPPDKETEEENENIENIEEIETEKEELKDQQEMELTAEEKKFQIMYLWEQYPYGQGLRACILLVISFYRKNILIPLLIIVKNIGRMLLFQTPELFEDLKLWRKEKHVICLPEGLTLSEEETILPSGWYNDGIQIKILFPFSFRTSDKGKRLPPEKDFGFLTALGTGSAIPYGEGQKRPFLFKPVLEDFKKRIITLMNKFSRGLKRLEKRLKPFFRQLFKVFKKKEYKQEYKQILEEGFSESGSYDLSYTNNSSTETQLVSTKNLIKLVTDQKNEIINKMGPKKTNYNDKRLIREKWQILKRINVRTICKLPRFLKVFIVRIYKDKFLSRINILKMKMAIELFISRQRKIIYKINEKSTPFTFILPREEALDNIRNSPTNSHNFDDLSYVSQAYVFYRLAKIQDLNLYKLKSFLHSQGISLFLKPEIKDSFEREGVVHSKWVDKKLPSYEMNQWKNWLRGHDQYNLSEISWAILKPEKWRNRIHQRHIAKNENLCKWHSYEKDQLIDSKKEKQFKGYSFFNQKENFQKEYRYDLLSYKFLNYENKTEYFFDRSPFQRNKNYKIYSYESKKTPFFNNLPINIHNYIKINRRINLRGVDGDRFEEKMANRKYFDWKILDFHLKPKEPKDDIQISEFKIPTSELKIERKQKTQGFFGWMGMNEKKLKHSLESWFFPEFVLLYNAYQRKPWFIPHKSLFLNLKINKNILNILKINKKNKKKEKPSYENIVEYVMKESKKKDQLPESTNFLADEDYKNFLADEDYKAMHGGYNILAFRRDLYRRPFELYQWSVQEDDIILTKSDRHIFLYKLLLSLRNEKKRLRLVKTLSYSRELKLEIMWDESGCVERVDLLKNGFVEIEIFLFQQNKGQLLMYQTVGLSLIHKNKHKINKKYQEQRDLSQRYLPRNHFDEAISTHEIITEKRNQNPFKFQLLVPETILSFRSRRKLRIFDCFHRILLEDFLVKLLEDKDMFILTRQRTVQQLEDLRKSRITDKKNPLFWNEKNIKNSTQVSHDNKHLDRTKNQLIQLKHFLWPNYRLEDLACMNRYWFDTYNGSRFSMLRILMYPRLKRFKIFR
uniref:Ycf1 n=1 Tax=Cymbaria daurica TaxID=2867398 RepID=UPI0020368142|nr:Ycf1 [Cymbaria daurica]URC16262.1 Ycf1 [Cymbaria daurica]